MASRRMARSIAEILSAFQSLCCSIRSSSSLISFAAPSKSSFANLSVKSAAAALFQNCSTSLRGSFLLISHWKSICIAYSRDFERRPMLLAPRFRSRGLRQRRGFQLSGQLGHFDGCLPGFEALVATFKAGAVNRLFESVASQYAKDYRNTRIHLRELQAP